MEDRKNVDENSCNSGDGTDQKVQSLMFMMMKDAMEVTKKEIVLISFARLYHHLSLETEGKHKINLLGFKPGILQLRSKNE